MKVLTEKECEDFLESKGLQVVNRHLIVKKEDLKGIKLGFPWVMKISSRKNTHKTKVGGTALGIKSLEEAKNVFDKLIRIQHVEGILIQEQANGQELIIGFKQTPEFGDVIMLGRGGTEVEKHRDVSFRIIPIKAKDANEMTKELKIYIKNPKEVVKSLLLVSDIAEKNKEIIELDINPLIVNNKKVLVADARMVIK